MSGRKVVTIISYLEWEMGSLLGTSAGLHSAAHSAAFCIACGTVGMTPEAFPLAVFAVFTYDSRFILRTGGAYIKNGV